MKNTKKNYFPLETTAKTASNDKSTCERNNVSNLMLSWSPSGFVAQFLHSYFMAFKYSYVQCLDVPAPYIISAAAVCIYINFPQKSNSFHTLRTDTHSQQQQQTNTTNRKKCFLSSQRWNIQIIIAPNCKDQVKKISFLLSRLIYETNFVLSPCVCVFVVYQMRLNAFKRQNGKLKQSKSSSANFYKQDR